MPHRILLASGDQELFARVRRALDGSRVELATVASAGEVPRLVERDAFGALLIDLELEAGTGLELLECSLRALPELPVIVLGCEESAAAALRAGAVDYVERGELGLRLRIALRNALTNGRLQRRLRAVERSEPRTGGLETLVGRSETFRRALGQLERAARKDVTVLLVGETGTGKEEVARALHVESGRADEPFVTVRCAALPTARLAVELFGERANDPGAFEEARRGTVLLEDVDRLPRELQDRLVELLHERRASRMDGSDTGPLGARLVATATRALDTSLREDLRHRLSVYPVVLPTLAERGDDVELLALASLRRAAEKHGRSVREIEPRALEALGAHDWPRNLHELESAIERALLASPGDVLRFDALPADVRRAVDEAEPIRDALGHLERSRSILPMEEQERRILVHALECTGWNVVETARRLRIGRATVYRKLDRFGLRRTTARGAV